MSDLVSVDRRRCCMVSLLIYHKDKQVILTNINPRKIPIMINRILHKGNDGLVIIKWKGLLYIRYPQTKKFERVSEEMIYSTCMSIKHAGAR